MQLAIIRLKSLVEPVSTGLGISPLLIELIPVAAAVGLYLVLHKKHNNPTAARQEL